MASGQAPQAALSAGLRNSIRFVWKEKAIGGREWFVKTMLMEGLKVDPGQVFCLQWNAAESGYDLTLHSQVSYDRVLATCTAKADLEPFSLFRLEPLGQRSARIVTVHMYNPYVGDAAVALFLSRYGKVDKPVKYLRDSYGIWSGRRQFRVLLGDDPDSSDGLRHPPAYFTFGGERGFLFYSGQPSFCRQCRSFGHMAAGCTQAHCRNCGATGHGAASCSAPRVCHSCGATGHLSRECPSRGRTYAAVAGDRQDPSPRPSEKGLQEVRGSEEAAPVGMGVAAVEVVSAVEVVLADGEAAVKEVLPGSGGSLVAPEVLVSLGDSLPLEGSWGDCEMDSENGESADAVAGGVRRRRRRTSSGGEQPDPSVEAGHLVPFVLVRKRKKKRKGTQSGNVEAGADGPQVMPSGDYNALSVASEEDEYSEGGSGLSIGGQSRGPEAGEVEDGSLIVPTDVDLVDVSRVASRPVSPLSLDCPFLEAGLPRIMAYLPELVPPGLDIPLGKEAEETVGETVRN